MSEPNIERILEYLRANAGQYGLEALRGQLITAGYAAADVDAAIARLQGAGAPSVGPTEALQPGDDPAPQPDSDELRRALAYVAQNRGRYDESALRGALLETGYPPHVVDEALRRVAGPAAPAGPKKPPAWPIAILFALANYFAAALIGGLDGALGGRGILFILGFLGLLVAEGVAGTRMRGGPRDRLGRALILAPVWTVLLVVVLGALLFGVCIILIAGTNFNFN